MQKRLFVFCNLRALSANRVDFGFFCFINFQITPPPPTKYVELPVNFDNEANSTTRVPIVATPVVVFSSAATPDCRLIWR